MNKYKISIIIPVYNAEKYLSKCLSSICSQTYTDLEIICVNDGSMDQSPDILAEFEKKDSRINVIHQSNKGESASRNIGLKNMTGDFVAFVDSDDWIEPDMYETLIMPAQKFNVDFIASGWYKDTDKSSLEVKNNKYVESYLPFDRDELLKYLYMRDSYRAFSYMWNKLYKKELFYDKNNNLILFDENIKLGGDVVYLAKLAINTKKAVFIEKSFYHYVQRQDSTFHTQDLGVRNDILYAYVNVIDMFEAECVDNNILIYVKRFLAYHACENAKIAYRQKEKKFLLECQDMMKRYLREYVDTNMEYPERINQFKEVLDFKI